MHDLNNAEIARTFEDVAELLEAQDANPYRVRSWRAAAGALRKMERPAAEVLSEDGVEGLRRLPTIGASLARAAEELLRTGRLELLERLRGDVGGAEALLATVPGIGPVLAQRIHERLGILDLQGLEAGAHDGRLASVPGMGAGRVRAVREILAGRFRSSRSPRSRRSFLAVPRPPQPAVSELLDVDREYRERAEAGLLPRIASRAEGSKSWLPVLHTRRGARHYTAIYSDTPRARELHRTHDWVVIHRDDPGGRGHWTVVTARAGDHAGHRIVRGLEDEAPTRAIPSTAIGG